ncbi:hypothetical protein B0A75_13705 [Flavobacterium oncorhynchi]|uniref:YtkA-like domain-containing protein n=1 Tax=Flavobacterium oncorhynchi TaxID=728056 RepID=A0A226HWU6_9FLAO|nr:hypothetical protein [Flavobacterium oncorhynchi]OXA98715.1 hypothetical protein B0A75_13705 [Flavobacterium oncorhynchi]
MKTLKYITLFLLAITYISCSSDDDSSTSIPADETLGLQKIQELTNDNHVVELYSKKGTLIQGYNTITIRIKDKKSSAYITDAKIDWTPIMHMTSMQHSCPKSAVTKTADKKTLYSGDIIFQMAQNDKEFWELKINYTINNVVYTVADTIAVTASPKRTVTSFKDNNGNKYVLAYIAPENPKVAVNDAAVGLYKMEDMMTFTTVNNFKIKIDPRMPSMGNHGSPNNTDLVQFQAGSFYKGKLSLTMTGYWKINMQLLNASDEVLKGEPVTTENPASSLYFEIEF